MIALETERPAGCVLPQEAGGANCPGLVSLLAMLERYAFSFYEVVFALGQVQARAAVYQRIDSEASESDLEQLRNVLSKVHEECTKLALQHTADMTAQFESRYAADQPASPYSSLRKKFLYESIKNDIETLKNSFSSELRREMFFRIPLDKERYFEKDNLFGDEVAQAFPSCDDDIRNAGTCFALERYDASVFHLMQVLQLGLNALARKFNVAFEYSNWERVLNEIDSAIRKMSRNDGQDWREQRKLSSAAASQFYYLKEAIRNHVMHARDRYDEGKALSVYRNVEAFMHSLAAGGISESDERQD